MKMTIAKDKFLLALFFIFFTGHLRAQPISITFSPTVGSLYKVEIIKETYFSSRIPIGMVGEDIYSGARSITCYLLSFATLECTDDGYVIALSIDSTSTSTSIQSQIVSYPESFQGSNIQRDNDYVGKTVLLHISKEGKILDLNGIEDMVQLLPVNSINVNSVAIISNMVKELVQMVIPEYTCASIEVGQAWDCVNHVDTGMYIYVEEIQYALVGFDAVYADLSMLATMKPEESDNYMEILGVKMSMKPSGTAKGTLKVSRDAGWAVEAVWEKNQVIEMDIQNAPMSMPPSRNKEKITLKKI